MGVVGADPPRGVRRRVPVDTLRRVIGRDAQGWRQGDYVEFPWSWSSGIRAGMREYVATGLGRPWTVLCVWTSV